MVTNIKRLDKNNNLHYNIFWPIWSWFTEEEENRWNNSFLPWLLWPCPQVSQQLKRRIGFTAGWMARPKCRSWTAARATPRTCHRKRCWLWWSFAVSRLSKADLYDIEVQSRKTRDPPKLFTEGGSSHF